MTFIYLSLILRIFATKVILPIITAPKWMKNGIF